MPAGQTIIALLRDSDLFKFKYRMTHGRQIESQRMEILRCARKALNPGGEKFFIPDDHIKEIWTSEKIQILFQGLKWNEGDEGKHLINQVQGKLLKVVSILTLCHWTNEDDWNNFYDYFLKESSSLRIDANLPFSDLRFLRKKWRGDFQKWQFYFTPIKIHQDEDIEVEPWQTLPFVKCSERVGGQSSFGTVTKVLIEKKHYSSWYDINKTKRRLNVKRELIVRKEIPIHHASSFVNEKQTLEQLKRCESTNSHIMYNLATVTLNSSFNILMAPADLDLEHFLTGNHERFNDDAKLARYNPSALFKQCKSLAGALNSLHHELIHPVEGSLGCILLDLKPENILIQWTELSNVGFWMLADFGVSVVKNCMVDHNEEKVEKRRRSVSPIRPPQGRGSDTFTAPEIEQEKEALVSTRSDMWSFGGIVTNVLAFAVDGPSMVKTLRDGLTTENDYFYTRKVSARSFKSVHGDFPSLSEQFEVKPELWKWFEQLLEGVAGSEWWIERCKFLVQRLLKIEITARWDAEQAREELQRLLEQMASRHAGIRQQWTFTDSSSEQPIAEVVAAKSSTKEWSEKDGSLSSQETGNDVDETSVSERNSEAQHSLDIHHELDLPGVNVHTEPCTLGVVSFPTLESHPLLHRDSPRYSSLPRLRKAEQAQVSPNGNMVAFRSKKDIKIYHINVQEETMWLSKGQKLPADGLLDTVPTISNITTIDGEEYKSIQLSDGFIAVWISIMREKKSEFKVYRIDHEESKLTHSILKTIRYSAVKWYLLASTGSLVIFFYNKFVIAKQGSGDSAPINYLHHEGVFVAGALAQNGKYLCICSQPKSRDDGTHNYTVWDISRLIPRPLGSQKINIKGLRPGALKLCLFSLKSDLGIGASNMLAEFAACDYDGIYYSIRLMENDLGTLVKIRYSKKREYLSCVEFGFEGPNSHASYLLRRPPNIGARKAQLCLVEASRVHGLLLETRRAWKIDHLRYAADGICIKDFGPYGEGLLVAYPDGNLMWRQLLSAEPIS